MTETHPMRQISVEKLTLNIGAGRDDRLLKKGQKLIKNLTGKEPVTTKTQKRIQGWGLRPGLPIGVKLTLRGEEATEIIDRLLYAKDYTLQPNHFDDHGNVSFGIPEYVDIKDIEYDTKIGIIGLQASITLKRPGFRIKNRKIRPRKIPDNHRISAEDAQSFFAEQYNVTVREEETREE